MSPRMETVGRGADMGLCEEELAHGAMQTGGRLPCWVGPGCWRDSGGGWTTSGRGAVMLDQDPHWAGPGREDALESPSAVRACLARRAMPPLGVWTP